MARVFFLAAVICAQVCSGQDIRIVKLPELQRMMTEKSDDIHVINFWATWCAPCVKELPIFEKVNAEQKHGVKILLVSLDLDLDENSEKVYKFVARKNIKSTVLLLDERDPGSWIDKIEKQWSGSLPATLVINHKTGKRLFVGRSLREGELEQYLDDVQ